MFGDCVWIFDVGAGILGEGEGECCEEGEDWSGAHCAVLWCWKKQNCGDLLFIVRWWVLVASGNQM